MSWHNYLLGEFVEQGEIYVQTGPFGTQLKASDYVNEGTPVINVRNIGYGELRPDKLEFVPEQVVIRLKRHLLQNKDIVFGRKGAVDRHLLVTEDQTGWMQGSDCIRIRINTNKLNAHFLSFAFRLGEHKKWIITQCSNKATMASLNQDVITRIPIKIPQRKTQNDIASILSAYDDLIENNRRRIQLLEQAARLLYKEWFIHLRFPGHEHVKIKDGVPEGWEKKTLAEVSESVIYGYTVSASQEPVGPKFLRITDIVPDVINWETVPYCSVDEKNSSKFALQEGDVVVARTGATVGYAKRIGMLEYPVVFASYLVRFRFKEIIDNLIPGIFMESWDFKNFVINNAGGAAQPNANAKVLSSAKILLPSKSLQKAFRDFVWPLFQQRDTLQRQNIKTGQARDLLLPRLMNGEISV